MDSIDELPEFSFENAGKWWDYHREVIKNAVDYSANRVALSVPDIMEGLDILSAIRGPQELCMDMITDPDNVKKWQDMVDRSFYGFYDDMYEKVKLDDGSSVYTAFHIVGKGRTAKIQCDFSCLISTEMYDEFVLPALRKQCDYLDKTS